MVRKPEIQYIRYYSAGSAARVAEAVPQKRRKKATLPEPKKQLELHIGPLAFMGLFMCVVMVVMMAVGMAQLHAVTEEADRLEAYVDELAMENGRLRQEYERGYDLRQVESMARGMGLIPLEEASRVSVWVPMETQEQESGFWHTLTDLFG